MSTSRVLRSRLLIPMISAPSSSATFSSRSSWTSTSALSPSSPRLAVQRAQLLRRQRGDDQQDRVGPGGVGLVHLVGVDDEVLAQQREGSSRGARWRRSSRRAAEAGPLGQDRERGGAAAFVGADHVLELQVLADRPGRRGAPLVLGDHRQARPGERRRETSARARRSQHAPRPPRTSSDGGTASRRRANSSRVAATIGSSAVHEETGASSLVRCTNRFSASAAAPSSIARSAARTPDSTVSAPPPA